MGKDREVIQPVTEHPEDKLASGAVAKPDFGNVLSDKETLELIKKLNPGGLSKEGQIDPLGLACGPLDFGKHDPFRKDFNDPNESGWTSAWRGLKGLLGFHDTVEDKIREKELSNLTPEQKKQYEQEEAAMTRWMTQATINPGPMPEQPMHQLVEGKVRDFEAQIRQKVLEELTPQQRADLEKERQQYNEDYKQIHKHDNPMGGPLYQPEPKTGPTTDYVEKMIQKRAEEELLKH